MLDVVGARPRWTGGTPVSHSRPTGTGGTPVSRDRPLGNGRDGGVTFLATVCYIISLRCL